ncbi:von Willebrand factor A domain-containing protein 5A [Lachnellula suecica]|uniref:von Willebrand factor A domain-containing protein 5A n=1 Tax=Lachnellula suecica TaxID=602035 RepID=A0A8T9C9L8_9HELO|nr:von Willebrand factor A domain-containing protein 5A [Lachnellula suecica]
MYYLCGCYYTTDFAYQKQYLPLLDSEAHTTIRSTTSRTVLKQTFTNPSTQHAIKECIYTFPLYDGVSVVSFTCRVGQKVLRGLVKEKVKAKEIFDEAVAKGETAGLLEQAPESSDVFSTKLGNIPAGESVIVEITYIGELKHHETDGIRFTIPTSIAPRYGSGPSVSSGSNAVSPRINDKSGIKIVVDINMQDGTFIKGVQSPSHPIAVSMGTVSNSVDAEPLMSKASATLSLGSAALEKDFVLIVQSKDVGIPKAFLETHPTIPNHRALMATLVPKFSLPPSRPEIVFVADRSGSMGGNIEMLVSAMQVFLKSMPAGVKFNICSFGSSHSFLWQQSKSYTKETLDEATRHLTTFSANMGGTETFGAIKATVESRFGDIPLEIMLLTDGDIWNQESLFRYLNDQIEQTKGKIRVFPLGIGNGVSHSLIEGLARAGNGFAQAVQHGERLENSVVRMLRGALTPHITDYTLEVKYEQEDDDFEVIDRVTDGMKVLVVDADTSEPESPAKAPISLFDSAADPEKDDLKSLDAKLPRVPSPKLLQAPHKIPSLFAFSRTVVYLLMSPETIQRNPTAVVLRATSEHGPLALEIPIEVLITPGQTIHQLAAKKAVQDLEEGRGWIFDAKDHTGKSLKESHPSCFDDLVKQEAVRLGEKFQIAGKYCSFVAVSANDQENRDIQTTRPIHHQPQGAEYESSGSDEGFACMGSPDSLDKTDYSAEDSDSRKAKKSKSYGNGQHGGFYTQNAPQFHHPQQFVPSRHVPVPQDPYRGMSASYAGPPAAGPNTFSAAGMSQMQHQATGFQTMAQQPMMYSRSAALSTRGAPPPPPPARDSGFAPPALPAMPSGAAPPPSMGSRSAGAASFRSVSNSSSSRTAPAYRKSGGGRGGAMGMHAMRARIASPSGASFATPAGAPARGMPNASLGGASSKKDLAMEIAPQKEDWATKSPADKVLALIALQDFEGSWSLPSTEIGNIMGVEVPGSPKGGERKAWVTLLVVAFLEQKMVAEEGTWALVVEKARGWLEALGVLDLEDLEKEAVEFVKKL